MRLLTIPQVAEVLQVKPARAYDLVRCGVIPAVRLGRQIRVNEEHLNEFVRSGGKGLPGGWRRK